MADASFITRRAVFGMAVALPAAMALPSMPLAAAAPTESDVTRYYAFLWMELHALSRELGVAFCDSHTAHRNGDIAVLGAGLDAPPSRRAMAVLAAAGADCATLQSGRVGEQRETVQTAASTWSDDVLAAARAYRGAAGRRSSAFAAVKAGDRPGPSGSGPTWNDYWTAQEAEQVAMGRLTEVILQGQERIGR